MTLVNDHNALVDRELPIGAPRVARAASYALLGLAACLVVYDAVPQARATTNVQNRLILSHDRFGVAGQPQDVVVRLARIAGEPVSIRLDDASAKHYELAQTLPAADTVATAGGTVLTFDTATNSDVFEVALTFKPMSWGHQNLNLSVSVAQRVTVQAAITQFIAPALSN